MTHYKLLTLVCFTITVLVLVGTASAKTWYVDDDDDGPEIDFTKIQLAVDAASDGDTIEVESGTYYERVNVDKQLILMGVDTGEGKPVVDAERDGSPIAVMVDGCTVDGFNAIGSDDEDDGAGIRLESSNNMIANNLINSNHGRGIFLLGPSNNNTISTNDINHNDGVGICLLDDCVDNRLIDNNVCFNGDHGIELEGDCTNSTLLNNNASFNGEIGIYIIECDNATLTNNTVSNNEGGIFLNDGRNYILRNNTINNNTCNFDVEYGDVQDIDTSNTIGGKPIYYLVNQANVVIDSSWNAGYVGVVDSNNITVKDLTLTNNGQGVLFDDVQNSRIENMIVENNTWGIYLMDSSGITLRNNNANSNEKYGIYIDDEYDNSIDTSNTVNGKPVYYFYDIHDQTINNLNTAHLTIAESSNIIIKDNNISGGDGIVLSDVDDSNIINNLVSGNFYGIHVDKSNNNIFTSNYANLNKNVGIDIDGDSTNNIIANNHANENGLHGIKIDGDSNNNTITNNYANANYGKCGIRISADNNTVSNNHAAFNTLSGIHVANSKYNRIANNNASFNGRGICVWYSSTNNIIINNTLSNNEWGGSSLHKSDSNEFIGNTIFNNSGGGLGGGGSYNSFINNDIHGGYGSCISLSGNSNIVKDNRVHDNHINSVYAWLQGIGISGDCNSIVNNTVYNNIGSGLHTVVYGIHVSGNENLLTDNEIYDTDGPGGNPTTYGVYFEGSNSTLTNNTIYNTNGTGLGLCDGSNDNTIYHNNFIDNNNHSSDYGSNNSWDNGPMDGGNYWSGHEFEENPSNGSQPYYIQGSANAVDTFPFKYKNGWLNVTAFGVDVSSDNTNKSFLSGGSATYNKVRPLLNRVN